MSESINEFIGLPYTSFDCYDLVKLFYHKVFSVDLNPLTYTDPSDKNAISRIVAGQESQYRKVTMPKFGDIILFRTRGLPAHVGIYLDEKVFLHTRENTDSVVDRISRWEKRIIGFYRCPDLDLIH